MGGKKNCSWHLTKRISSWALVLFTWFIIRSTRVIYTSIKDSRGSIRQPPLLGLRGKGARSDTTKSGRAQRGQMFFWFYDPEPKNTTYLPFSVPLCPVVGSPVFKTSCLPPAIGPQPSTSIGPQPSLINPSNLPSLPSPTVRVHSAWTHHVST